MEKKRIIGIRAVVALAAVALVVFAVARLLAVEAVFPLERAALAVRTCVWPRLMGVWCGSEAMAENGRLRRELSALSLRLGDLAELEAENARLRRALGYAERLKGGFVAGQVLSRGGGALAGRPQLRLNRGSLAGVAAGAVVVSAEGLVGRVTAVTPHTAEVALVGSDAARVSCRLEGGSRNHGIVAGRVGDRLVVRLLSGAWEAPVNSRVVTTGRGGVFPAGLEVGSLLELKYDAQGRVESVELESAVDAESLTDVFVLRPAGEAAE